MKKESLDRLDEMDCLEIKVCKGSQDLLVHQVRSVHLDPLVLEVCPVPEATKETLVPWDSPEKLVETVPEVSLVYLLPKETKERWVFR